MSERDELEEAFYRDTAPLVEEVRERLLSVERTVEALSDDWKQILGLLHTIKGNCGMMQVSPGERLAHTMERRAGAARRAPLEEQTGMIGALVTAAAGLEDAISSDSEGTWLDELVDDLEAGESSAGANSEASRAAAARALALAGAQHRVPSIQLEADVLDRLLELVGELVISFRRVSATRDEGPGGSDAVGRRGAGDDPLELLGKQIAEIRQRVLDARLVPMQVVVGRFVRLVRDLERLTDKPLSLSVEGDDTVVDKNLADHVGEPLLHLIRNAADHGIEKPAERREAGKPERGRIELHIAPSGGDLVVAVRDDGAGLSRARLEEAAAARGIDTSGWSEQQIYDLIFRPEFSTAERVTKLSGRGVGMPQIKRSVEDLGGELQYTTRAGAGATFYLRVPLAAAIQKALIVECDGEPFALPIRSVAEAFRVTSTELHPVDLGWVTTWRGQVLPGQYLARQLERDAACPIERARRKASLAPPDKSAAPDEGPGHAEQGQRARSAGVSGASPLDAGSAEAGDFICVVVADDSRRLGLFVDRVVGQQEVMVRSLDPALGRPPGISGVAIVGEGSIAMVLDPRGFSGIPTGAPAEVQAQP